MALAAEDAAPSTRAVHLADIDRFARWLEEKTGEPFDPAAVTTHEIAAYQRRPRDPRKLCRIAQFLSRLGVGWSQV
jgi:hypothetical protein